MNYQELYIYPNPEIPRHKLRDTVFGQLHYAFVNTEKELASDNAKPTAIRFGVSFPNYHSALNDLDYTIRVFAPTVEDLKRLDLGGRLKSVKDYLRLGQIQSVPEGASHVCFSRKRVKTNLESTARRQVKRGNFPTYEIALAELKKNPRAKQSTNLPFIWVASKSTNQKDVPLFIQKTEVDAPVSGTFNSYGLSQNGATVPMF